MRLLLLSNSKNAGEGFLDHAEGEIRRFLEGVPEVLFLPYAGVRGSYADYADRVRERFEALGCGLVSLHEAANPPAAVTEAQAVVVGGGNTFHLVRELYRLGVLVPLRERAAAGLPYLGWSAGANIACPTLQTTNDMPIVEPPSFRTLGLVPFQINPHFTDAHPPGHMGETRSDRIREFVEVNPGRYVVGLREGSMLRVEDGTVELLGPHSIRIFRKGQEPEDHPPGASLQFLLEGRQTADDEPKVSES